jgi:hypothetical protein
MTATLTPPAAPTEGELRGALIDHEPHPVQHPPRHTDVGVRRQRLESFVVFLVAAIAFGALGYWVVAELHVVAFDALDRMTRALMVWHNDPPKLATVGFAHAPLITVALLPFTVVPSMAASLLAIVLCSAAFGGLFAAAVHRALRRACLCAARYAVVALVVLNPLVAFAASTGSGAIVGTALATIAVAALVGWYATVDARYLVTGGLAFGAAAVADYQFIGWMLLAALVIAVSLGRHRAQDEEIEGSLIMFLTPGVFVLALWTLFNGLVTGDPLGWLSVQADTTINAASSGAVTTDIGGALAQTAELVLTAAPLALLVLPALAALALAQRNALAGWLAAFLLLSFATPVIVAADQSDLTQITLDRALPILALALIGAAWLYQSLPQARSAVLAFTVVGLLVSVPLTWRALEQYPYQSMAQAFHRAVDTGNDQEGTRSRGGLEVGVLSERAMAEFLAKDPSRVLTDNARTFGVIALTGRPEQFFDRADLGDAAWQEAAARPPQDIRYFLFSKTSAPDELRRRYPSAASGEDPRFLTVYDTPRYRLVAVPAGLGRPVGGTTETAGANPAEGS